MDAQIYYSKLLAKTLITATIGGTAGTAVAIFAMHAPSFAAAFLMGLVFAGLPSGWSLLSRLLGKWVVFNIRGMVLMLCVKGLLACVISCAALPVRVVYCAVKCLGTGNEELAYAA